MYPWNYKLKIIFFWVAVTSHRKPQCQWLCNTSQSFVVQWSWLRSVWSLQQKGGGKQRLAIHSHFRQSLCLRDFWRQDWSHEQCITLSKVFSQQCFFPFFIAPLFTFLSSVSPCLSALCRTAYPLLLTPFSISLSATPLYVTLSFYPPFPYVEISQLIHQSHYYLVT